MNKIFKVIWNPATGSYNVASETAKSRGKKSGRSKLLISALVAGGLLSSFGALAAGNEPGTSVGTGSGWVALGQNSEANAFTDGNGASTAVGYKAKALGTWSSAIGALTSAIGDSSMAFGVNAVSTGQRSIAMGASSNSVGEYSMALGRYANSGGGYSIAQGDSSNAAGQNATAVGSNSSAAGTKATALGNAAKATKIMSIALGDSASASEEYSMALGASSKANGTDSLALGRLSVASAANAIAMGAESEAAENATAIGNNAHAKGVNSIAMGSGSIADKVNTIALGNGSQSLADNAIAIGQGNKANGTDAIALGNASLSSGLNSIALGKTSVVTGDNSLALGSNTNANGINSVALGADSIADQDNSVSVGSSSLQRKIVNVKNGAIKADSHDAINGSQLYAISDSIAKRLGGGSSVNPDDGTVNAPTYNLKNGNKNNVGSALTVLDENTLQWDQIKGKYSAVHGSSTTSVITDVANGTISAASKDAVNGSQLYDLQQDALLWNGTAFSAAHGTEATSKITNVTAGNLTASSTDAVNGSQLKTTNDNVTTNTTNIATNTTNITNLTDSVGDLKDDSLLWNKAAGAFSAAHGTEATSKITNLLAGKISSNSTDAINGSQLYGVADSFTSYLGGGADINNAGVLIAPTYTIGSKTYNNVGDALNAINSSFSTSISDALLWDSTANKFSAKHGGTNSIITNVADGTISSTSSDAVNGSQLYDTSKYIADALGGDAEVNADGTMTAPTYSIANEDYHSVGEALDALDDNALLWDEDAGAYNASHDGNASKITNVAAGDLSTTSTDAVNGSQLNATNILVTQNSQMINQLAGNTSETYIEENGAGINYVRTNDNGLAFNDASASGIGATAVGYNSVAEGDSSVAIGQGSSSSVDTGIALGSSSVSSRVIVKGSRNTSVTENGVVIGYDTTDGELLGALSIGDDGKYRQIINVADGSEAHDAVTVRQLQNAIGAVATTPTKYFHANSTAEDSLAVGEDSLAMGAKTIVNGNAGIGIGLNTLVLADAINGIAIGSNARANHADSIAMGNGSQTTRGAQTNYTAYNMDAPQNSVGEFSVGSEDGQRQITNVAAGSADTDAVNVGQLKVTDAQVSQNTQSITNLNTQVTNLDTRVTNIENGIGDIVTTGSTKYFKTNTDGADANAQGKDSVAIGSGSIAAADNSVALGTGSVADEENTISVGSSTNQRRITNVAAGVNATDAVNVSQLKSSEAGGVRYDTKADGSIDYSNITLGGGNGGTTRISNVSAGVNNNDAVNYAQLKQSVQETKQYTDQRMVEMDNKLSKTESKLSGGIASAMAMTGLPQAYTPGASMPSIGGGTYNGESAVALGVSMVSANGRWVYKLQGSTNSQGEYSAALGAGIQW
ncbi:TPA: YadA-like family protein [Escherichia coli]|uniref:YadA-like family protein n=1 Tax=Escherichia coli TaxID=562 RepID=UPI00128C1661|nr:YadA-like family protein [Escherichia coli]EFL3018693.1 adhesin [Escherichia coli]EJE7040804.1 YadA-like family protein [Escherichia coli]ELR0767550.1 YadA-like family protein [Escherichia coli]ELW2164237.1 YadA-like family protein [Escherichia coli]ELX1412920.1 YadA-like family protein [Escherichia coli]